MIRMLSREWFRIIKQVSNTSLGVILLVITFFCDWLSSTSLHPEWSPLFKSVTARASFKLTSIFSFTALSILATFGLENENNLPLGSYFNFCNCLRTVSSSNYLLNLDEDNLAPDRPYWCMWTNRIKLVIRLCPSVVWMKQSGETST